MSGQLFVYYRVPATGLAPVVAAVRQMQATLQQQWPGLRCQLLRRPELRDGEVTLMECYAGVAPDALQPLLEAAASTLPQPRHTERFEPLD